MLRHHTSGLFDQDSFYVTLTKGIAAAKDRVIIERPFITSSKPSCHSYAARVQTIVAHRQNNATFRIY